MAAEYAHNHYYIGQPLTGKDAALINNVLDDLDAGLGLIVIDPHGSTINKILARYPKKRDKHLIIFDPSDSAFPIAFNPLEFDHPDDIPNIVSFLLESMKAMAKYDGAATHYKHFICNSISGWFNQYPCVQVSCYHKDNLTL
jgi:hypothetical protein